MNARAPAILLALSSCTTLNSVPRINKLSTPLVAAEPSRPDWRWYWNENENEWHFRFCTSPCMNFNINCLNGPNSIPTPTCDVTSDYTGDADVDLEDFALYQSRYTTNPTDEYGDPIEKS